MKECFRKYADMTGGAYFRATDTKTLQDIYNKIDKLEKSKVEITSYRQATELFYNWLGAGLILILLEFSLSKSVFRKSTMMKSHFIKSNC